MDDLSLVVEEGRFYGLLGPNGAGKTSLIRIVNQIIEGDSGTILFNGRPLQSYHIKHIGYLPEERGLYKKMKVAEQLLYFAQLKGMAAAEAKAKIKHWLERLEMSEWRDNKIEDLSKGMAQKIQFIATVIHAPELLILDEPFSGFDPVNADTIKNEILTLRETGTTVILSTHRMESVDLLCDHIAMIHKSHKVIDGTLQEIKKSSRPNVFEVKMVLNEEEAPAEWMDYKVLTDHVSFAIQLDGSPPNMVLRHLMRYGEVLGFNQVLPSIEEIFIQKVKENDHG